MRILVVTPKVLDVSLSASTRLNIYDAMSTHNVLHVVGRFRTPAHWNRTSKWAVTPILAPRIPGLSMLWFHLAAIVHARRLLARDCDAVLVEPDSLPSVLLARRLLRACQRTDIRIVLDVRTMPIETHGLKAALSDRLTTFLVRRFACRCDAITAITPGVARWISCVTGIAVSKIAIWSTGVDSTTFDPSRFGEPDVDDPTVRFLYHGVLYLSRGLDNLVHAATLLTDMAKSPFTITMLGAGPDTQSLKTLIAKARLDEVVTVAPPVPQEDVPAQIARHDVGVVPLPDLACWASSSPTKLLEYMAMARPVVLTDILAHRDIVGSDTYAVWAGGGDASSLAEAMARAIESLEELKRAAPSAREKVLAHFTWEQQAAVLSASLKGPAAGSS